MLLRDTIVMALLSVLFSGVVHAEKGTELEPKLALPIQDH